MFPRLFHIGDFSLPTYGVLAAAGLLAALSVVVRGARREGIDPDRAWNLGIVAILSAIVGAKVLLIANDWEYYSGHLGDIFSLATLQAAAGALLGAKVSVLSDGVDKNDLPFRTAFPYVAFPSPGSLPWKLNPRLPN